MKYSKLKISMVILLSSISLSCKTTLKFTLFQPYYFLGTDSEIPMIEQKEDSIYSMKCHIPFNCTFYGKNKKIAKQFEVIQCEKETYLLKVISPTALRNKEYEPSEGYWVVKKLDENRIRQYTFFPSLIKDIDTAKRIFKEVSKSDNSPGFTLYTKRYLEQLNKNPAVATVQDVESIIGLVMSKRYKTIVRGLAKEQRGDVYGAGAAGELYTLASIELGFNPVGAGIKIDSITTANSDYFNKRYGL